MPYDLTLYPVNWPEIARRRKRRAGYRCQMCGARHGEWYLSRFGEVRSVVVTTAHPNHDPWNPRARLCVWCSRCHLRHDAKERRRKRLLMGIGRALQAGQLLLWSERVLIRALRL